MCNLKFYKYFFNEVLFVFQMHLMFFKNQITPFKKILVWKVFNLVLKVIILLGKKTSKKTEVKRNNHVAIVTELCITLNLFEDEH